ncbi:hypothetical protein [Actinoplanes auranticolor]|uniref:Lipoprotein n=1 Tax=Actinoplanes auranticolor TaxID=47988 RepID=A0A919VWJ6_9ACTN|nr:hypothetical protein [Actinoplanes auranticolor]GIM79556.1 hypothetical protein Aau02nite_86370 [Actinoplanes auranticolor]
MKRLIAVALAGALLAGCSSSPAAQSTASGCVSAAPDTVVVTAAVRDGRADPAPHRVKVPLDSAVLLRVDADVEAEVHVHGYDLATVAKPGGAGCVSFVADRRGLFDVEAHPESLLVQLEVR